MAAERSVLSMQLELELARALQRNGGNVRRTAKELRIPYRTAHEWITRWGLRPVLTEARARAS